MKKILIDKNKKTYLVKSANKDVHLEHGMILYEDIKNAKSGDVIRTNKNIEIKVLDATFLDLYKKLKRCAQIIMRKDLGIIITETGITKKSIVIESGAGSGATGCFLSQICKHVYSYEIRKDFFEILKTNIEFLGIKNMTPILKDAKEGYDKENVADVLILDVPDPWHFIEQAHLTLKTGGYLVSYSPCITQVSNFVKKLNDNFILTKTTEIMERDWIIDGDKVRPESRNISHTGFLSFSRKI